MLRAAVKLTSLRRLNVFREFSEIVRKKFDVKQGGGVFIDFHKSNGATIEISTAWQDHCDVEYDSDSSWKNFSLKFTEKAAEKGGKQKLIIEAAVLDSCTTLEISPMKCLKLVVPEMFDVSIIAHHLDLRVKNKVGFQDCAYNRCAINLALTGSVDNTPTVAGGLHRPKQWWNN